MTEGNLDKINAERLQAYLYLIQEVIRCPVGGEQAILAANADLLDPGLVEIMQQMAKVEKDSNTVNRLKDLAKLLKENLSLLSKDNQEKSVDKDQFNFIFKVLQATADSNGNPEVVYPLLEANLDKLDDNFIHLLQTWASAKFSEAEPKTAKYIAIIIWKFSNLIQQFPLGNKVNNMEIAIASYEEVLNVFTRESHPESWATTQNNLGAAYRDRIRGDKAENLENAIASCHLALEVYTKKDLPINWAMTQNNLGNVYRDRIRGDKAENLEIAIAAYNLALQVRTKKDFPIDWAGTQNNLGVAYDNRIRGDKAENLENAIAAYNLALEVHTKKDLPINWAMTQNNLGNIYRDRIRGDKAENLENAIASYHLALEVYTKKDCPINWAMTQNNLGTAYDNRIRGDKAENLENAIASYHLALEVYTKKDLPIDWAQTQNNLGAAYGDRIRGDKAENLENAIASYRLALEVRTKKDFPIDWAMTQNNLGNAYRDRIRGDKAENLENAIASYRLALEVYTKKDLPINWAGIQHNLGLAYGNRIRGDKAENLENAIAAYNLALEVHTKKDLPINWAMTQNNLGLAYGNRIRGDKAENLENAIAAYNLALEVYTKKDLPINWAMTQNNLGTAYDNRIRGDKAENLEIAIAAYNLALEVYTKKDLPINWAMTQNNLGNVYRNRIRGDKAENLENAIAAYNLALEVRTLAANPIDHLQTTRNLGNLHFTERNWQPAINAYQQGITAVELSRSEAMNDQRRQEIMAKAIKVYQKLVQAYINLGQFDKAIETVERSKARNLVELLTNRDLYPKGDIPQEIIDQLDVLRRNIPSIERQLQVVIDQLSGNRDQQKRPSLEESQKRLQQKLQQSRQQLDQVLNQIKPFDPSFSLTEKVEQIPLSDIQSLIDENTAIIEWYVTNDRIITSVITRNSSQPIIIQSSTENLETLIDWANKYLFDEYYANKDQWINNLPSHLTELAKIIKIDDILAEINNILTQNNIQCDRLILIPHRFLHLLPFHALPLTEGDLLCDRFSRGVSYAPSCQILQLTQRYQRPHFNRLFAIQNPTEDLVYTNLEVETVCSSFSPTTVLAKEAAREADVKTHPDLPLAHCNHFSCHGYFNFNSPLESALILAESEQSKSENTEDGLLTLAEIFALNFNQSRLVTLSACETGMADFQSSSDEYISLPSGFLFAGSPSVVSSLWTVSDISTSFLMIKFYENLKQYPTLSSGTVALALNQAQKWLRELTVAEFDQLLIQYKPQLDQIFAQLPAGKRLVAKMLLEQSRQRQPQPFANPYYWAAFTATGF